MDAVLNAAGIGTNNLLPFTVSPTKSTYFFNKMEDNKTKKEIDFIMQQLNIKWEGPCATCNKTWLSKDHRYLYNHCAVCNVIQCQSCIHNRCHHCKKRCCHQHWHRCDTCDPCNTGYGYCTPCLIYCSVCDDRVCPELMENDEDEDPITICMKH